MKTNLKRKIGGLFLTILYIVAVYFIYTFLLRPILEKSMATEVVSMIITAILLISTLVLLLVVISLLLYLILLRIQHSKNKKKWKRYTLKSILALFIVVILLGGDLYYSQKNTYTKPICNEYNDIIPNSISTLEKVKLGDQDEWITIRGKNKNNPVLLVLDDGPGKSEMSAFSKSLEGLEENFVVVNWDEIGAGKSYKYSEDITMDTYIRDGNELTKYLCNKFAKNKIYILGNSFGSALGLIMASNNPELYEGFIGTSPLVSVEKNEKYRYNKALEMATEDDNENVIRKLKAQGEPPYEEDSYQKQKVYSRYLKLEEDNNYKINGDKENIIKNVLSSEYGLVDKLNFLFGQKKVFNKVYKSYYEVDLINNVKNISIPVYFFKGNYDLLSSKEALDEYYANLNAPRKEIIEFEKSGSQPWISESDKFVKTVNEKFLNK